jgi:SAM-dependent methyltransferase
MTVPDPRTVYWMSVSRIQFHTRLQKKDSADWEDWVFPQTGRIKTVQDGDWDALRFRVADMRICRAVEDRVRTGVPWQSTEYYRVAVKQIETGRRLWGCTDRASFDHRCNDIDRLIESISKHGYRDGESLGPDARIHSALGHQEILINISRDGFPLFQDGRHRLAIARALGLGRIPVQILVRHSKWQMFREFMHRMARGEGGASREGILYQNPVHFDLGDIPSEHSCEDRWNAIVRHLPSTAGIALDIGCNLGFFCHQLEEAGYSCIGVEYLPDIAYAAQRIAKAENRRFKIVTGDILAREILDQIGTSEVAVAVALNIFHHFIKTEGGYSRLREFLGRLRIGALFFEPHHQDDPQMKGMFSNPSPEEFARLVKDWGGFGRATPIYTAADGRTVFMLDRQRL